jgi:hypothetical protein
MIAKLLGGSAQDVAALGKEALEAELVERRQQLATGKVPGGSEYQEVLIWRYAQVTGYHDSSLRARAPGRVG